MIVEEVEGDKMKDGGELEEGGCWTMKEEEVWYWRDGEDRQAAAIEGKQINHEAAVIQEI